MSPRTLAGRHHSLAHLLEGYETVGEFRDSALASVERGDFVKESGQTIRGGRNAKVPCNSHAPTFPDQPGLSSLVSLE
jgi:hypothetical protein